jgi:hypothetical protein
MDLRRRDQCFGLRIFNVGKSYVDPNRREEVWPKDASI